VQFVNGFKGREAVGEKIVTIYMLVLLAVMSNKKRHIKLFHALDANLASQMLRVLGSIVWAPQDSFFV
jgi:hypothetical protein